MKKSALEPAGPAAQQAAPEALPQPDAVDVLASDEHAGHGGSYLFDPATGRRTLQPEPTPPNEKE